MKTHKSPASACRGNFFSQFPVFQLFTFVSTSTISCCLTKTLPLHLDRFFFRVFLSPLTYISIFPRFPPSLPFPLFSLSPLPPISFPRVFLQVHPPPYFPCFPFSSRDSNPRPPALKLKPLIHYTIPCAVENTQLFYCYYTL